MRARSGFVAIAGRPNVGKSTLLNRVLGAKVSIVTPKAQTTRERVLGILTEPGRGQIVFVDTPGIHRAREGGINAYMMQEAREGLEGTSAVWYLVDPATELEHEELVHELLARAKVPVLMVMNKVDLRTAEGLRRMLEEALRARGVDVRAVIEISALRGKGVAKLLESTWELVPEGAPHYPDPEQISDRPLRYFAAEKVREQLLLQLGDELPYSCAVEIERYDESARPPRIEAVIHVERDSQKGMVIGKGGQKIKAIGTSARQEIQQFVGEPVFLGLKVKVLKDWSKDANALRRLGYVFNERPAKRGGG